MATLSFRSCAGAFRSSCSSLNLNFAASQDRTLHGLGPTPTCPPIVPHLSSDFWHSLTISDDRDSNTLRCNCTSDMNIRITPLILVAAAHFEGELERNVGLRSSYLRFRDVFLSAGSWAGVVHRLDAGNTHNLDDHASNYGLMYAARLIRGSGDSPCFTTHWL